MNEATKKKKIFDGRYEVLSIVGRGPCSVVYHARHATTITAEVALKVLVAQPQRPNAQTSAERLRAEALAMVSSRHRYVIRLDDFHSVGDLCYLAMEYAPFGDLRKYAATKGNKIDPEQGERFLMQTAEAIDFVHRVGIIHRDIKPDNILVLNEKEIRLADFGVAVLPGEKATLDELKTGVGTMSYMPPEVLEGKGYEKQSDIYALGVSFYEMLTGTHPFDNVPLIQQLEARQDRNIVPPHEIEPSIPEYLSVAILQAMSYEMERRFPSARDLIQSITINRQQRDSKSGGAPAEKPKAPPVQTKPQQTAPARSQPATATKSSDPVTTKDPYPLPEGARSTPGASTRLKPGAVRASPGAMKPKSEPAAQIPPAQSAAPKTPEPKALEPKAPEPKAPESTAEIPTVKDVVPEVVPATVAEPEQEEAAIEEAPSIVESPSAEAEVDTIDAAPVQAPPVEKRALRERRPTSAEITRDAATVKSATADREPAKRRPTLVPQSAKRSSTPFVRALLTGVVLFLGITLVRRYFQPAEEEAPESSMAPAEEPAPPAATDDLEFPHLPPGLYFGSMQGALPGQPVPMTIISLGNPRRGVIVLGVQGWSPRQVSLEDADQEPKVRVASNGILLDFEGKPNNGAVSGSVRNVMTGEEGTWWIRPAQR